MEDTIVARPINAQTTFIDQVDIVIPFHGQYQMVTELMQSIYKYTRSNYYHIYLVDDCSPNAQYIANIQKNIQKLSDRRKTKSTTHCIRLNEQVGFAGAMKAGYDAGESPYVCFVNSDCLVENHMWLRGMGETLVNLKDQNIRMVSAVSNNAVDGHPAQQGGRLKQEMSNTILEDGDYLSLFCFMVHRDLFKKVGGFFKQYSLGMYEDIEFAARMNYYGYKQAVCNYSWIHHEGRATIRDVWRRNPNIALEMDEDEWRKSNKQTGPSDYCANKKRCIADLKKLKKTAS